MNNEVGFEINHPYNGVGHYGPRSSTKCYGMAVTLTVNGKVLIFNGINFKGVGHSVGVKLNADCIDELIEKLTAMRTDIIIANL